MRTERTPKNRARAGGPGALLAIGMLSMAIGPAVSIAGAEPPDGDYEVVFSGAQRIWNPIGEDFESCETESSAGFTATFCSTGESSVDAAGRLDGSASFEATGDIQGTLLGTLIGSVKGSDRGPDKASFTLAVQGVLNYVGIGTFDAFATARGKASVTDDGLVTGTMKMKICLEGVVRGRRVRDCGSTSLDVTDVAIGGDWTLLLSVVPGIGGQLSGTARAVMIDGGPYDFGVIGRYDARRDESSLVLAPTGASSEGASLSFKKLETTGAEITGGQVRFKLRGIKGKAEL